MAVGGHELCAAWYPSARPQTCPPRQSDDGIASEWIVRFRALAAKLFSEWQVLPARSMLRPCSMSELGGASSMPASQLNTTSSKNQAPPVGARRNECARSGFSLSVSTGPSMERMDEPASAPRQKPCFSIIRNIDRGLRDVRARSGPGTESVKSRGNVPAAGPKPLRARVGRTVAADPRVARENAAKQSVHRRRVAIGPNACGSRDCKRAPPVSIRNLWASHARRAAAHRLFWSLRGFARSSASNGSSPHAAHPIRGATWCGEVRFHFF